LPLSRRLGRHQSGLQQRRPELTDDRRSEHLAAAGLASLTQAALSSTTTPAGKALSNSERRSESASFSSYCRRNSPLATANSAVSDSTRPLQPLIRLRQSLRNLVEDIESALQLLCFMARHGCDFAHRMESPVQLTATIALQLSALFFAFCLLDRS
jgi:hypothetical protein